MKTFVKCSPIMNLSTSHNNGQKTNFVSASRMHNKMPQNANPNSAKKNHQNILYIFTDLLPCMTLYKSIY